MSDEGTLEKWRDEALRARRYTHHDPASERSTTCGYHRTPDGHDTSTHVDQITCPPCLRVLAAVAARDASDAAAAQLAAEDTARELGEDLRRFRAMYQDLTDEIDRQERHRLRFVAMGADPVDVAGRSLPRIVTTIAQLDGLPPDAVVVDRHGAPHTKRPDGDWTHAEDSPAGSSTLLDGHSLALVWCPALE